MLVQTGQGILVRVSPSLIERKKVHFHNLPCGASLILSNNGNIWICETLSQAVESGGFAINMNEVQMETRTNIARLRNCILILAKHKMMLYDTSILFCYEESLNYEVMHMTRVYSVNIYRRPKTNPPSLGSQIKDLLLPDCCEEIAFLTKERLKTLTN